MNASLTLNYTFKTADLTLPDGTIKLFSGKSRYSAIKRAIGYIQEQGIPTHIAQSITQLSEHPGSIGPKIDDLLYSF